MAANRGSQYLHFCRSRLDAAGLVAPGTSNEALVRSVGLTETCPVDVYNIRLKPGQIFLSCSDGLSGMSTDKRIARIIQYFEKDLSQAPRLDRRSKNEEEGKTTSPSSSLRSSRFEMTRLFLVRRGLESYTGPFSLEEFIRRYEAMDFSLQDEVSGSFGPWIPLDNLPALKKNYPDVANCARTVF